MSRKNRPVVESPVVPQESPAIGESPQESPVVPQDSATQESPQEITQDSGELTIEDSREESPLSEDDLLALFAGIDIEIVSLDGSGRGRPNESYKLATELDSKLSTMAEILALRGQTDQTARTAELQSILKRAVVTIPNPKGIAESSLRSAIKRGLDAMQSREGTTRDMDIVKSEGKLCVARVAVWNFGLKLKLAGKQTASK